MRPPGFDAWGVCHTKDLSHCLFVALKVCREKGLR